MDGMVIKNIVGRTLVSKFLNRLFKKKLGHDTNVNVKEFEATFREEGGVHVCVNMEFDIPEAMLWNFLK